MANTVTQRTLYGAANTKTVVRLIHILSDGSEETDLVVYDNSAFVNDVTKGKLMRVCACGSAGVLRLEWDQTTDSPAIAVDASNGTDFDFTCFGGISNPNGTGATGDLVLTTSSLDANDEVTLILVISQE